MSDDLNDLIQAADPLLTKEAKDKEFNREQLNSIVLMLNQLCILHENEDGKSYLAELCDRHETRQKRDDKFLGLWIKSKVKDSRLALWFLGLANLSLFIATVALYIDATGSAEELVLMLKYIVS